MAVLTKRCAIAAAIALSCASSGAADFATMRWQTFEEGLASAPRTNRPTDGVLTVAATGGPRNTLPRDGGERSPASALMEGV